jgi:hypothetical protein
MRSVLKFVAPIFLIITIVFAACKKEKPSTSVIVQPPAHSGQHRIKARIVEYGTDKPLVDATVDAVSIPNRAIYLKTDGNGECWFDGAEVALRAISKAGYWNYGELNSPFSPEVLFAPVEFSPGNLLFDYNNTGKSYACDSFVVKLFPKTNITVHIKDSLGLSTCNDCNVIFAINGLFRNSGINYTVFNGSTGNQNGHIIRLRSHIDSTFQCPVFGNANNLLSVGEDDVANGWSGFNNFLHVETRYIPDNTNFILYIAF